MKISVVIPCLNAAAIIKNTIKTLTKKLKKINIKQYELIFVDDGSSDGTSSIIKNLKIKKCKLIINEHNLGKSSSLIIGIKKQNIAK